MASITDDDWVDKITKTRMMMNLRFKEQREWSEERKTEREHIAKEWAQWEAERE
jgi:hypothetical protein